MYIYRTLTQTPNIKKKKKQLNDQPFQNQQGFNIRIILFMSIRLIYIFLFMSDFHRCRPAKNMMCIEITTKAKNKNRGRNTNRGKETLFKTTFFKRTEQRK